MIPWNQTAHRWGLHPLLQSRGKWLLVHPHGCLHFSYTEMLAWEGELKNNCISTCIAQIYLAVHLCSCMGLFFLWGFFSNLEKKSVKIRWIFQHVMVINFSPHIHILTMKQYLPFTQWNLSNGDKNWWNLSQFATVISLNQVEVKFCIHQFIELLHVVIYTAVGSPLPMIV